MTLNNLLSVTVAVRVDVVLAEIGGRIVIKIGLIGLYLRAERVGAALVLVAEVVGNDVADNLDAVLVRLSAKGGQLSLCTEPALLSYLHADGLVELPPLTAYVS